MWLVADALQNVPGQQRATLAYTAFGEPVGSVPGDYPRYQYAGGYDYESGLLTLNGAAGTAPTRLQHVGYRWYQPRIGRFVQRDPIGLGGGLNCYVYAFNNAIVFVDPDGQDVVGVVSRGFIWLTGGRRSWLDGPGAKRVARFSVGVAGGAIGGAVAVATAPLAAPILAACFGYTVARQGGMTTGDDDTDGIIDGFVTGVGLAGGTGLKSKPPRFRGKPGPPGGVLHGFPGRGWQPPTIGPIP